METTLRSVLAALGTPAGRGRLHARPAWTPRSPASPSSIPTTTRRLRRPVRAGHRCPRARRPAAAARRGPARRRRRRRQDRRRGPTEELRAAAADAAVAARRPRRRPLGPRRALAHGCWRRRRPAPRAICSPSPRPSGCSPAVWSASRTPAAGCSPTPARTRPRADELRRRRCWLAGPRRLPRDSARLGRVRPPARGRGVVRIDEHAELGIRRRLAVGVHAGQRQLGTIWVQEGADALRRTGRVGAASARRGWRPGT